MTGEGLSAGKRKKDTAQAKIKIKCKQSGEGFGLKKIIIVKSERLVISCAFRRTHLIMNKPEIVCVRV